MVIQWYPGHMAKAHREMQSSLKVIDIVCYVLDARAPQACINPEYKKLTANKPCVFVFNKIDLADTAKIERLRAELIQRGDACVLLNSQKSSEKSKLIKAFQGIPVAAVEKLKARGVYRPTRILVVGVPNCGKSTLINLLGGKKVAVTGDRPGVTKGQQWVRLCDGIELLDTPGTLWSNFDNQATALRLAFIGSVKDDIIEDLTEVAAELLKELASEYPALLAERYGIDIEQKGGMFVLDDICRKRGYIVRGGEADLERGAKAVIDDFRKGRIGKITLCDFD
ncbi:MAG: ribosome biogenesis GTPase YlqF [Clostridia bacterium]|nr:ribosome biogenesis GTPase YlqF [Clostridia bacterium]